MTSFFTPTLVLAALASMPLLANPVAVADAATMHRGQKVLLDVLANDTGTTLPGTVTVVQAPQFGTAVPNASGKILYHQSAGNPSTGDTFTYRVSDASGPSNSATVNISFSNSLRIQNLDLNVPAAPPPTSYEVADAFGSLAFANPVCMATPPGETQRLFICQKGGLLRMVPNVTAATPTASTFLDLPALLATRNEAVSTTSEQGLLGLAFHPNYASNRYFYVFYSVDKVANAASPIFERISRFTAQAGNPNLADPASEQILIEQEDQANNHNGGDLHFGPDGYLYISLGDEGNQNDSLNNSQRLTKDFFAGLLRIDVDKKPGNLEPNAHPSPLSDPATNAIKRYETSPGSGVFRAAYSIPLDNPFVRIADGGTWNGVLNGAILANPSFVRSEFWAIGLRNPWRMSFDPPTGELWVGDVGGGEREEIDVITKGGNYGWNFREGFIARPGSPVPPSGFTSLDPVYDYPHSGGDANFRGASVTGGFVYRGTRLGGLAGAYLFADYSSGNIWSLRRNGANPPTVVRLTGQGGIAAFAKDPSNGDVLMANVNAGRIRRLVSGTPGTTFPQTLSATRLFAELTDLSPAPGLLPYQPNLPFWSDYAVKRRWFIIPSAADRMTFSPEQSWTFPSGQIWVKHFDIETVRGNPATKKRLETRLLVKNPTGSYGVSYRWNTSGTEANLVSEEGADFDLSLTVNGGPYTQRWRIPSRSECMICHTPQAGHALSFNTRQLNRDQNINGFSGNQLKLLEAAGYFTNSVGSPNLLARHVRPDESDFSVEARVRSYLAVNCAYCHKDGGTAAPSAWDGRAELTLTETGLVNGLATNNGGNPSNRLVVPGNVARSVVLSRMAVTCGLSRMPPLGSNELDTANIALLTEWIQQSLPAQETYDQWRLRQFSSTSSSAGTADADPDGDGSTNRMEYLAMTNPLSSNSLFQMSPTLSAGNWSMSFLKPVNHSAQVEISANLVDWSLWNVPGNAAIPGNGNSVTLEGPAPAGHSFFRVRLTKP